DGNAYVTGIAIGAYPTTPGAFDTTNDQADAFVTKLNAAGSALGSSTFLGGGSFENGKAIELDGSSAYVAGETQSAGQNGTTVFPPTAGAYGTRTNAGEDAVAT